MLKKKKTGYLTVEASLLFPFILVVQIICIYLMLYCYDRCVMEQCAYEAALAGSDHHYADNQQAYEVTKEKADYLIEGRLFSMQTLRSQVTVTGSEIAVVYEAEMLMPFHTFTNLWIQDNQNRIRVEKRAPRINPVKTIRIFSIGKGIS